jgi:hypothetical protein
MASPTLLLTSSEGGLAQDVVFLALALTMTKGDGECHGCVKSDALGNRSASFAFGRPCSSKVSRQNSHARCTGAAKCAVRSPAHSTIVSGLCQKQTLNPRLVLMSSLAAG